MNILKKIKSPEVSKLISVFIDQVFMSITTLMTAIVLARTYEKSNYADLVLLFSISVFVLGFQSAIISKPYAININDFKDDIKNGYFNFNMYIKILFTCLVILFFPLIYFLIFGSWDLDKILLYIAYMVAYTSYYFVRETLLSERKTKQNLIYGLVSSTGIISLLFYIFLSKNTNINIYLIISSTIYGFIAFVYFFLNIKKFSWNNITSKIYILTNWEVGKWLLGSNIFFFLSSGIYPWLLLFITTKNNVAVLGVLSSVSSIINPLLMALSSYLLPIFVKVNFDYNNIRKLVKRWVFLFGILAFLLIITGYFFGQSIVILFFGQKYANLGLIVVYPFIVQAINVLFQPYKISLNAIKRTDVNFLILIPRSILALTLGYFFITNYGLVGTFYAMIIEILFYQVLNYLVYLKVIRNN